MTAQASTTPAQATPEKVAWHGGDYAAREAEMAEERAESRRQALAILTPLLAVSEMEAARYLAKWLIWRDVARGYSLHEIALGHRYVSVDLGCVEVTNGRRIHVQRIGPFGEGGHDCDVTFSLKAIYDAVKRDLRTAPTAAVKQQSLWAALGESEVTAQ